jgi:predicted NBD/HSP70 family sugar kinase
MDQLAVRSLSAGVNQQGVREHNERLILSMIQRHGTMPASDIARRAGLSPQTVSVILRGLETEGFVERGDPVRGKVGKPSIPMALAPEGAYSVGLKVGRRSADLVLTDFNGQPRQQMQFTYRYPMPQAILGFLRSGFAMITEGLGPDASARIAGIGIAAPFEIWNWHETLGAPAEDMALWKDFNLKAEVAKFSDLPVFLENDATAACRAEQVYGRGKEFRDFAYFFIGSFIGGGIVLNHSVFEGPHGNAGSFGSLPVQTEDGRISQLIDVASIYLLESDLARAGIDPRTLWSQPQDWSGFPDLLNLWLDRVAGHLARAALTVCAVVDFEAVLIDGAFPVAVRNDLVARTRLAMEDLDLRGLVAPRIEHGTVGQNARAAGAAATAIFERYFLNTHSSIAVS